MKTPLLSIVMPYYNRADQLLLTLKTIECSSKANDIEIIILDDGSDKEHRSEKVAEKSSLNIKNFYYLKKQKTWKNPCYLFNEGFKKASGDIIVIQNPECFHVGDVIKYAIENTNNNYLTFSCKNIKENNSAKLLKIFGTSEYTTYINKIKAVTSSWYNHPKFNPTKYHFTSSISRKNLKELGGFDLRYKDGHSFDDDEFLTRIKRSPINIVDAPSEVCFSVHQWHSCTRPLNGNKDEGWKRNYQLFENVTKKEQDWKANESTK